MAGTNLKFSKVVSTPTPNAWSQAYSAGSLFATFSLESESTPQETNDKLSTLGKEIISTLESEFFPLEKKDLESIKQAVTTTISKVENSIKTTFVVCYLNDNILYLYAGGGGKGILKRGEKIGTVIDSDESNEIKSASGYVQNSDVIILQTKQFQRIITPPTLAAALEKSNPDDITEELAPNVHEKTEGGASAIILSYNEGPINEALASAGTSNLEIDDLESETLPDENSEEKLETATENDKEHVDTEEPVKENISENINPINPMEQKVGENNDHDNLSESTSENASSFNTEKKSKRKLPGLGIFSRIKKLSRKRKIIIITLLFLIIIIAGGFTIFNRGASNGANFDSIYNEAKAKYDEGQSLKELNASLAQENFKAAQVILIENQNTFPDGSSEDDQIEALLVSVNNELGGSNTSNSTTATEVDKSESQFLSVAIDNSDSEYFTQNEDFILFISKNGVIRLDKGNSQEETLFVNSWEEEGGIGIFGSNVYVLDKTDNILKFTPTGDEYSQSDYITGDVPSLTDSTSMSIDGSVYVLASSGSITKFTRGIEDNLALSGLDTPLSSPTRIWANEDQENIYILDNGNSRIVVIDKEGNFVKAYSADIIKNARDFDVQETDGEIFILSGGKIYKIDLN